MPGNRRRAVIAAAWTLTGVLWLAELAEVLTPSRFLTPAEAVLDCATVCVTLSVTLWTLLERYAALRARDSAKVDGLYEALSAAYQHARAPVPPGVIQFAPKRVTPRHLRSADREETG